MKKRCKSVGKVIGILLIVVLLIAGLYVTYVMVTYKRIPDMQVLSVNESALGHSNLVKTGTEYGIVTYNIGFCAYTPTFSFFMDGGKSSVAESKESVMATVSAVSSYVKDNLRPDFVLFQEVDMDGTRSHHVNQYEMIQTYFDRYDSVFAINYDSAFLFYPFLEPHGKNKSGLLTESFYSMESSVRRSLPISDSFSKFMDLDRCYSLTKIPMENGKYLCLINLHLSAYGNDETIRQAQINMLREDMKKEYEAGNYVICGGDFNHDLKAHPEDTTDRMSWTYPFPREELPSGFFFCIDHMSEEEKNKLHNSARNANEPYEPDSTYTVTVDGFIISDNIECMSYENIDMQYLYSDHDPVYMRFILK